MTDTPPVEPGVVPAAAPTTTAVPVTTAAAPVRPEGLPDQFWDPSTGVKTADVVAALAAKADVPQSPGGYKLEPATPVLGPDGNAVGFSADDPLAQSFLATAHEIGLPQADVSKLLSAYATAQVAELKATMEASQAEVAKLGASAKARIEAVGNSLLAKVGEKGARAIMNEIGTAEAFEAMEKFVAGLAGPTISSPPPGARPDAFEGLHGAALLNAVREGRAGR